MPLRRAVQQFLINRRGGVRRLGGVFRCEGGQAQKLDQFAHIAALGINNQMLQTALDGKGGASTMLRHCEPQFYAEFIARIQPQDARC